MTVCKVFLFGLKSCEISCSTNDKISETSVQRQNSLIPATTSNKSASCSPEADYLNIDIKPVLTPTSSVRNNKELLRYYFCILAFFNK